MVTLSIGMTLAVVPSAETLTTWPTLDKVATIADYQGARNGIGPRICGKAIWTEGIVILKGEPPTGIFTI